MQKTWVRIQNLPARLVDIAVVLLLTACAGAPPPAPVAQPNVPPLDSLPEAYLPKCRVVGLRDFFPASARRARIQGRVLVEFGIGPSGRPIGARIEKEEPPGVFDESAISIVNIYRCPANTPATQKYRISIVYVLVPCPHPKPCQAPEPYPAMNPPITVTVTTTQ